MGISRGCRGALSGPTLEDEAFKVHQYVYPHSYIREKLTHVPRNEPREIPVHSYNGFPGPWIENLFISRYIDKPLSYFRGMIPIFVQFVDVHIVDRLNKSHANIPRYKQVVSTLLDVIRDDCIYVTVSQDDQGITEKLSRLRPNILGNCT